MSATKTFAYHTSLAWEHGVVATLQTPGRNPLTVAPPVEFGGPGDQWTPEEMLVGSVEACMMATFLAFARRRGLTIAGYTSAATGTLSGERGLTFQSFALTVRVAIADEHDRALVARLVEQAHEACFIGNSLRAKVGLDFTIEVADTETAQAAS